MDFRLMRARLNKMSPEERFWLKVQKGDGCWLWVGGTSAGYGRFHDVVNGRRVTRIASRMAYELTFGPIQDGLHVCHHCDNPPCCRPDHLFLGTAADNTHDAQRKGRKPSVPPRIKGPKRQAEYHHNARLTNEQVREIRRLYSEGDDSYSTLAAQFGVHFTTIYKVIKGVGWSSVA